MRTHNMGWGQCHNSQQQNEVRAASKSEMQNVKFMGKDLNIEVRFRILAPLTSTQSRVHHLNT